MPIDPYRRPEPPALKPNATPGREGVLTLVALSAFGLLPFAGLIFASTVSSLDLGLATIFLMLSISAWPSRRAPATSAPSNGCEKDDP